MNDKHPSEEGRDRNYDRFSWSADDIRIIKSPSGEADDDDMSSELDDKESIVDKQREEIRKILMSKKVDNEDLQKIIALANLIGGPDGDDAITETMYAYLTGIADWRADYAEFFSRGSRNE